MDLSSLSEDEIRKLIVIIERSVDKVCTVGRTLKAGTEVTFEVTEK